MACHPTVAFMATNSLVVEAFQMNRFQNQSLPHGTGTEDRHKSLEKKLTTAEPAFLTIVWLNTRILSFVALMFPDSDLCRSLPRQHIETLAKLAGRLTDFLFVMQPESLPIYPPVFQPAEFIRLTVRPRQHAFGGSRFCATTHRCGGAEAPPSVTPSNQISKTAALGQPALPTAISRCPIFASRFQPSPLPPPPSPLV
ncbi:MAG: hypothetical protein PCFJNLEI_03220 [Verrucomicrobiae bacterium]|nr:hypothetical protein [Verrucomicrobiae bacterium]